MIASRHIKRFFELSGSDRLTVMAFALRVPAYWAGLKLLGYPRFNALFIKPGGAETGVGNIETAKHFGKLVNMAVGGVAGGENCLLRSVMLSRHLAKTGYAPKIVFGVGKNGPAFQAHSWVEVDGLVVNDKDNIAQFHAVFDKPKT